MQENKYETHFFVSDLHGTNAKNLMTGLYEAGYSSIDKDHFVNVCGDITDGMQNEHSLIEALMNIEKYSNLNAIKGNHDFGLNSRGYLNAGQTSPSYKMSNEEREGVKRLPFEIETEHFIMAHGIYMEHFDFPNYDEHDREMMSIGGSPCLDINKPSDGGGLSPIEDKIVILKAYKEQYKNSETYCHSFKKDVYLGHFGPGVVKEKLDAQKIKYKVDDKGFVTCGKVNGVDSDVLHNVPYGSVKVKVVKYLKGDK